MNTLKAGELACFGKDRFDDFDYDKPLDFIIRTGEMSGLTRSLAIRACPRTPIIAQGEVEIMLYKIAGGEAHFVYSESRSLSHPDRRPELIETKLFLQYAPWGSGLYRIDLVIGKVVLASGKIKIG